MGLLLMLAGLGYGIVHFAMFVFCILSHEDPKQEELQKWLDSLPPREREAYLHHRKRQKEYAKFMKRRRKACQKIAQRMYDEGNDQPGYWEVWDAAGDQIGREEGWAPGIALFNSYKDVWDDPDWTASNGIEEPMYKKLDAHMDVWVDLDRWRDKPKRPDWA